MKSGLQKAAGDVEDEVKTPLRKIMEQTLCGEGNPGPMIGLGKETTEADLTRTFLADHLLGRAAWSSNK